MTIYLNPNSVVEQCVYPLFGVINDMQLVRKMTLFVLLYAFAVFLLPIVSESSIKTVRKIIYVSLIGCDAEVFTHIQCSPKGDG